MTNKSMIVKSIESKLESIALEIDTHRAELESLLTNLLKDDQSFSKRQKEQKISYRKNLFSVRDCCKRIGNLVWEYELTQDKLTIAKLESKQD